MRWRDSSRVRRVDDEIRVGRRLGRRGDAREVRNLARPSAGVKALAVPALALGQGRRHVDKDEVVTHRLASFRCHRWSVGSWARRTGDPVLHDGRASVVEQHVVDAPPGLAPIANTERRISPLDIGASAFPTGVVRPGPASCQACHLRSSSPWGARLRRA